MHPLPTAQDFIYMLAFLSPHNMEDQVRLSKVQHWEDFPLPLLFKASAECACHGAIIRFAEVIDP